MMTTLEEKKNLCVRCLIYWFENERNGDMTKHDPEVEDMFISKVLLKKFKAFNIDIILPDPLLLILDVCCESNPGQAQIILKDLLNNIKKRKNENP